MQCHLVHSKSGMTHSFYYIVLILRLERHLVHEERHLAGLERHLVIIMTLTQCKHNIPAPLYFCHFLALPHFPIRAVPGVGRYEFSRIPFQILPLNNLHLPNSDKKLTTLI